MIGKIFKKSSGSFKGRIRYIFGCTKHDHEISDIETIDSNCLSPDPLPGVQLGDEGPVLDMVKEFDEVGILRQLSIDSDKVIKPVFHAMLSLRPWETLTNAQWQVAVRKYMKDLGFTDACKYVAVKHRDKDHEHVHIVANRIQLEEDFRLISDSNERSKSLTSVDKIEDLFGLQKAPKPTETWGTAITHAELQASQASGDLPLKHRMIAKIAGAIEQTREVDGDMFTFVRLLRKQKVFIHLTLDDQGQPKGISYEFDNKIISGRQLKRSRLTWQKLTKQEGINYDPETIHELQAEAARRDTEEQGRVWHFEFRPKTGRSRRLYIRFTAKQIEVFKMIEDVLEILNLLFGTPFEVVEGKGKRHYIEYVPGRDLRIEDGEELVR